MILLLLIVCIGTIKVFKKSTPNGKQRLPTRIIELEIRSKKNLFYFPQAKSRFT